MTETKEQPEINGIDDEQQEDYNTPSIKLSDEMKLQLDESGKKYPVWNAKKEGEIVGGIVDNVEYLEHLNEGNGGWLLRIIDSNKNKFVIFPNKVMHKKLAGLTESGNIEDVLNMNVLIQYDGEKQPQNSQFKPYKTYSVIKGK